MSDFIFSLGSMLFGISLIYRGIKGNKKKPKIDSLDSIFLDINDRV